MSQAPYLRGAVVKGPNPFSKAQHRPYVKLSDDTHPFDQQEGLYAAITTTQRSDAIELSSSDFVSGGLPKTSYVSPWVITTFKHADLSKQEGQLSGSIVDDIAAAAASYLGVSP